MKIYPLVAIALYFTNLAYASQSTISFHLNTAASDAIIKIFDKGSVSEKELEELLSLTSIQASIEHSSRFDKRANIESYKKTLVSALKGKVNGNDPFQFNIVKKKLPEIKRIHDQISQHPTKTIDEIKSKIGEYIPAGLNININANLLIGGNSDGFVSGGQFYVGLHYLMGDYEGLKLLMSHEIFHLAQQEFFALPIDTWSGMTPIEAVMNDTLIEGSASLIGDPTIVQGGSYIDWFSEKFTRNLSRIKQNYNLFELIVFRLANDPKSSFADSYPLGFSGNWDSPLYYVGYNMAKTISLHMGNKKLQELYVQNPTMFFKTYIELYKANPEDDIVRFSEPIEKIILSSRASTS